MQNTNGEAHPDKVAFSYGIDTKIPAELFVGRGSVLQIRGWCYAAGGAVKRLGIQAGPRFFDIGNHSWARPDIFANECPRNDPAGNSLLSGFECFLPIAAIAEVQNIALVLRAKLQSGQTVECRLGEIKLQPGYGAIPASVIWPATGARIAVCMATYEPPLALFKAQLASLQAQTHRNWVCVISDDCTQPELYDHIRYLVKDDPRFIFFQNETRQNFYLNFQECLRRVPADADFVALCDQDDVWNPDKLDSLLAGLQPNDQLIYSDARVVEESGRVRSNTFWSTRRNNHTDISTLLVANTITGAASLFRASLLPDILPFPLPIGKPYHDQWIGLVALYKGTIGYVDRPLYDYVQHGDGVIGHNYSAWPGLRNIFRRLLGTIPNFTSMAHTAATALLQAAQDYTVVGHKVMFARSLLLRSPEADAKKRRAMRRFASFDTSVRPAIYQKILAWRENRPSLNVESMLLWSVLGVRLRKYGFQYKRHDLVRLQTARPGSPLLDAVTTRQKITAKDVAPPAQAGDVIPPPVQAQALELGSVRWIYRNIQPLTLDISPDHPKRVNVLLATINFDYIFGGYIGMFSLALRLKQEGYRVRIVLHEPTDWKLSEWKQKIQKYPDVTTLFDEVEITLRADRTIPIEVHPEDRFVATNGWAAHIAHKAAAQLNEKRFLFMVQEYEPCFVPMNSVSALFQQAYNFPQLSLFSTALLQDFFRRNKIGIFAQEDGEQNATVFSNAIQKFHPTRELLTRPKRRLLFYARPEDHAARNLFELGMIALSQLARDKRLDLSNWSFHGIGSIGKASVLELAPGIPLELVPKTSLEEYIRLMSGFDVGLSLMLTPHPSLVPLEMAAAGMWAVTNIFANKTAEALREISTNLIGVEPSVDGICDGLVAAMAQVDEIDARLAGAKMNWPTDWAAAFPEPSMQTIRRFLG